MLWGRVGGWSGCGGAELAAFRAAFRAFLRRGGQCPCCAGRRLGIVQLLDKVVLPVIAQCSSWSSAVAVLGQGVDMPVVATRCTRVQFLDKVVTCPLLRRLVHEGAVLGQGGDMPVVATTGA